MVSCIPWVRIPVDSNWVLYSGSQSWNQGVSQLSALESWLRRYMSPCVGRIHFLVVGDQGPDCLAGYQPGSLLLIAACRLPGGLLCLSNRSFPSCQVLLALQISPIPFCYQPEKITFKDPAIRSAPLKYYLYFIVNLFGILVLEDSWESLGGQGSPS